MYIFWTVVSSKNRKDLTARRTTDARNSVINRCTVTSCCYWAVVTRNEHFLSRVHWLSISSCPVLPLITHTMRIINRRRLLKSNGSRASYISSLRLQRSLQTKKEKKSKAWILSSKAIVALRLIYYQISQHDKIG